MADKKSKKERDLSQVDRNSTIDVLKFSFSKEAKDVRKQRKRDYEDADKARRHAKRDAKRAVLAAHKASIWDGWVHDTNGVPLRKYSKSEWFFDNKPLAFGVCALLVILPFALLLMLNPQVAPIS